MTTTRNSDLLPCFCRSPSLLAASQQQRIVLYTGIGHWVYIYCWYETGVSVRVLSAAGRKDASREPNSFFFLFLSQTRDGDRIESTISNRSRLKLRIFFPNFSAVIFPPNKFLVPSTLSVSIWAKIGAIRHVRHVAELFDRQRFKSQQFL